MIFEYANTIFVFTLQLNVVLMAAPQVEEEVERDCSSALVSHGHIDSILIICIMTLLPTGTFVISGRNF